LRIISARGVGPTGFGVGGLLGTCIAVRELYGTSATSPKVVLFTGDGGLMNGGLADLETLVRLNLNCTIVVINNRALGFVKFGQIFMYRKRLLDTDRPTTHFAAIMAAFGGTGLTVDKLDDLDATIHHAVHSPGVHLIDVLVDPQELLPPHSY